MRIDGERDPFGEDEEPLTLGGVRIEPLGGVVLMTIVPLV